MQQNLTTDQIPQTQELIYSTSHNSCGADFVFSGPCFGDNERKDHHAGFIEDADACDGTPRQHVQRRLTEVDPYGV